MPIIEPLKVKYQLSEDGKTIMLLSPDDENAPFAKEGKIVFDFDITRSHRIGYVVMDFFPSNSSARMEIGYLTPQFDIPEKVTKQGFVKNSNSQGMHREKCFDWDPAGSDLKKVKHFRFANEAARIFVTEHLRAIDFRQNNKEILEYLEQYKKSVDLLRKEDEGMKIVPVGHNLEKVDLQNALEAHAEALGDVRDEFVQSLSQKEYMAKPAKHHLKMRRRKGNVIQIIDRESSTQSVFMQIINWIMDRVKGVSDLDMDVDIRMDLEGQSKYILEITLSDSKGQNIINPTFKHESDLETSDAFILKGSAEALEAFANELRGLDINKCVEEKKADFPSCSFTQLQEKALKLEELKSKIVKSVENIKEKGHKAPKEAIKEQKKGKSHVEALNNEAQEENKEKGGGGATLTR